MNTKFSLKSLLFVSSLLLSSTLFSQKMTWEEWQAESKTNIRLMPKYGWAEKSQGQIDADKEFIGLMLKQDSSLRSASEYMIEVGFKYLYRDIKTAMYRFNQAYLLDSTNTDIYWGYGGVYMVLGQYEKAKQQYELGLKENPQNTHLLTDLGTYYIAQFYDKMYSDIESAEKDLNKGIEYMTSSYELDPTNQNTTYKLSVLYWNKNDCLNARKYYNECMKHGGDPITEQYKKDIEMKCPSKQNDY